MDIIYDAEERALVYVGCTMLMAPIVSTSKWLQEFAQIRQKSPIVPKFCHL